MAFRSRLSLSAAALVTAGALAGIAFAMQANATSVAAPSDGPADQGMVVKQEMGDADLGRDVFRFETFGNEGFWTDAVRLPAGMMQAKVTPLQALELGLQIDSDMLDAGIKAELASDLRADPTGRTSKLLNDPDATGKIIMAGAVMGMSPKNGKVGASCALCHSMSDASVFKVPQGGSIGHRLDGEANNDINLGKIFATAANTRALYTVAQLQLAANKGKTLGRAPRGLTANSTEAEFDAYFSNPRYYPIGMFDDTFDGNGDPMRNSVLFRQDLAGPYGSAGLFTRIDDFSNLVYTTLFDQTMLTTPGGRALIHKLAGAAGDEMIDNYVKILAGTGVTGYPYVRAQAHKMGKPGDLATPIGFRVNKRKLIAMNAYLSQLQAPAGMPEDHQAVLRGREAFRTAGCTGCHNVDQGRPVPATIHPMAQIFPGDMPIVLAERKPPLNPIMNTVSSIFDDKMAVVNASLRGEKRGIAMPLLLGLGHRHSYLHDDSVKSLDELLNPSRGNLAPHPFYLREAPRRADMIAYLRSLDTNSH